MKGRTRKVTDRLRLAERLEVVEDFASQAAQGLAKVLAPTLAEGEAPFDLEREHRHLLGLVRTRSAAMLNAEERCLDAETAHGTASVGREKTTSKLHTWLSRSRQKLDFTLGRGAGSRYLKLKGRTRRKPKALLDQAERALAGLRKLELPDDVDDGSVDPQRWLRELEALCDEHRRYVDGAVDALHNWEHRRVTRDGAIAEFDLAAGTLVRIAIAHYELAGLSFMAEKLRELGGMWGRPGPKGKLGRPRKKPQEPEPPAES